MKMNEYQKKAKKAQEELLDVVLAIFENRPRPVQPLGPARITKEAGLFKGLNNGQQNDRIAQGLINELLNRELLKKTDSGYKFNETKVEKRK